MRQLGNEVGLTSPAVTERVKKLEESHVISGYHVSIDYSKLGKTIYVFVFILVKENDINKFMVYCRRKKEIVEVNRILYAGANMMIHLWTENSQSLEKMLIELHEFGPTVTAVQLSTYFDSKDIEE